jgi:ubiquinone/menaquinone biosynthesis C-methylase UbiE
VSSVVGLDPIDEEPDSVTERIRQAPFPVERVALRADGELPFESQHFDCVVTTWTLCSIPQPLVALAEMRRVLKPGGHYLFVEHGRSTSAKTARWQDRLNPIWCRLTGGCNMNRAVDELVAEAGFALVTLDRFRHGGIRVLSEMYRGVAQAPGSPAR